MSAIILGFDPGRDKCGVAVMNAERSVVYHQVIESERAIAIIQEYGNWEMVRRQQ